MNQMFFIELDRQYGMDIKLQTLTDTDARRVGQLFAARSTHYDKMLFFKNNPQYGAGILEALDLLRRYENANYLTMTIDEKTSYVMAYEIMYRNFELLMQNPVVLKHYHHGLTQGVYINTSPLDNINPS